MWSAIRAFLVPSKLVSIAIKAFPYELLDEDCVKPPFGPVDMAKKLE
jgi:hypothetical protein